MAGQNKYYRLFKVAKELNVATGMLVDHLQEKGHDVDNSPNTKLSRELYDLLLKEFASEKLMKEKAEQLSERRKEEVRSVNQRSAPVVEETTEEETDSEFLSAEESAKQPGLKTPKKTTGRFYIQHSARYYTT